MTQRSRTDNIQMFLEYDVDGERSGVHLKGDSFLHTPGKGEPPVSSWEESPSVIPGMYAEDSRSIMG